MKRERATNLDAAVAEVKRLRAIMHRAARVLDKCSRPIAAPWTYQEVMRAVAQALKEES